MAILDAQLALMRHHARGDSQLALLERAVRHSVASDHRAAGSAYLQAANAGSGYAMQCLAGYILEGYVDGTAEDAVTWLERAMSTGENYFAPYMLGMLLINPRARLGRRDRPRAIELFHLASDSGNRLAHLVLARCYAAGAYGARRDPAAAARMAALATADSFSRGALRLANALRIVPLRDALARRSILRHCRWRHGQRHKPAMVRSAEASRAAALAASPARTTSSLPFRDAANRR